MPDMMNAVKAINDKVKRFVVDGTAGHLPISIVAYTVLPQMLLNFNLRLAGNNIGRRRQEQILKMYAELNGQYCLRYDVSHVTFWTNQILRLFESALSRSRLRTAELVHRERLSPLKGPSYLLELQPALYFQLAGMLDSSMATGHLALEQPKSTSITSTTAFSMPLEFPLCPELAEASFSHPRSDPQQFDQTVPLQPVLEIEDSAASTEQITGHGCMNRMLAPSISNSSPDAVHLFDEETTDVDGSELIKSDPASVDMLWSGIALFGE
ncbi:uncharacterized protein PFLUO_LOCUS8322 [Penicillium psychrofluorescens]|uniref:uncharacterized protein n=1 Tax=Penicillium psychrofluorescens TaxID=3158075 RepID=UPI003CCDD2BA